MATLDISKFHLTFDDEFNSLSWSPDGTLGWQTTFYFGGRSLPSNGEQEYYSDPSVGVNPFTLQNGELTITAAPGSNPANLPYNSGLITSEGMFAQEYGYFEVRAELPQGAGMWPAFWLLPADKSWPPEIDIFEAFGAPNANGEGGDNQVHVGAISADSTQSGGTWVTTNGNIYTAYHTYGVDWEADYITWYVDGQEVYQIATPSDMHKPMYMLANVAVGGSWAGSPTGETSQMEIDYIRAYSTDGTIAAVDLQPISSPDGVDTTPYGATTATGVLTQSGGTGGTGSGGTATSGTLVVRVSEDAWKGDAQFTVFVDGHQLGGTQTATASHSADQWQDITLTGAFDAGPHVIDVNYINDPHSSGKHGGDRILYVESVTIDGEVLPGPGATDDASNGKSALDPNAAVMDINGTAEFTSEGTTSATSGTADTGGTSGTSSSSTLYMKVSEDAWNGDAQFTVFVDGHQLGGTQTATALHSLNQWQVVALPGDFSAGPHTIDVNFINDAWGGTSDTDRNLYVQAISLNGETVLGSSAYDTAANGSASADPSSAVMMTNGTAEFKTSGVSNATSSTIVLHVSEDAWNGDAQFTVLVDGQQVGGTYTASASHSAGQWQDVAITGDFGSTGPGKIDVNFINDAWGGTTTTDRNLYVQSTDVNGVNFAGNQATDTAANGNQASDPNAAVMDVNGTVEFAVNHTTTPSDFWHL